MKYRKLDTNNDFTFGSGLSNYFIDEADGVAQSVQSRLALWQNEWFLDLSDGTPFLKGILGKYTKDSIDFLIKDRILNTKHVLSIDEYSARYDGESRNYTITATISTDFGPANIFGAF